MIHKENHVIIQLVMYEEKCVEVNFAEYLQTYIPKDKVTVGGGGKKGSNQASGYENNDEAAAPEPKKLGLFKLCGKSDGCWNGSIAMVSNTIKKCLKH